MLSTSRCHRSQNLQIADDRKLRPTPLPVASTLNARRKRYVSPPIKPRLMTSPADSTRKRRVHVNNMTVGFEIVYLNAPHLFSSVYHFSPLVLQIERITYKYTKVEDAHATILARPPSLDARDRKSVQNETRSHCE